MKLLTITIAAAALAAGASGPAVAQMGHPAVVHHTVVTHRTVVTTHRSGWNGHRHRMCTTQWRHHQRVRTCRWAH